MTIEKKIELYVKKKGKVLGCELPNKVFLPTIFNAPIKINSCADRIARRMAAKGKLKNHYNEKGRVVYSLGVQ
jgi:hypothetical protein